MLYLFIAVACVVADQLTKIYLYGKQMSLIGDFLWLKNVELNYGAGWSMFSGARWFFIIISFIIAGVIIFLLFEKKHFNSKFFKVTLGILLGGLVGNLIDRLFMGGVRDFLAFNFFDFPVFNVADIAITVATVMLVIYIIFLHDKKDKTKEQQYNGKNSDSK